MSPDIPWWACPILQMGKLSPRETKSLPRSRGGEGQRWDSEPGPADSPGLTLGAVLTSYCFILFLERKPRLRGWEDPSVS